MKAIFRNAVLAAAVGAACASPAWSMDLAEAYQLAITQDATLRDSRAAAEAVREKLPQARAQLLPNIALSSSRFKNQLEATAPGFSGLTTNFERYDSRNDTLQLRQPIFRKGLFAQYRQAGAQVADANASLAKDEQILVMRVTEAYFNVLLAEEQLVLLGSQKAAYALQAEAAKKSFSAGTGTRTDIDDAQARLDFTIAQEVEARQNIDLMRRRLQVIVNQPVTGPLAKVDVSKLQLTPPAPVTPEDWTALAESASPEIESARAQVEIARAEVEKAKSGHYPTLDAIASLSKSGSENITSIHSSYYQKQVGVQLSIPLFQGGYVSSQVREALARVEQAESRLDEIRRDLGVRVQSEFKGVTEGIAKINALQVAVKSYEQLVVSSRRSFEAGARTRVDILNAEQQASQARRDLAQARFTYLLSRVRLKALSGALKPENIDEINAWLQH